MLYPALSVTGQMPTAWQTIPQRKMPTDNSNKVLSIFTLFIHALPSACEPSARPPALRIPFSPFPFKVRILLTLYTKYFLCKHIYIAEARQSAHKKQQHHPERGTALSVYVNAYKGA
jgi:hypothetical protein